MLSLIITLCAIVFTTSTLANPAPQTNVQQNNNGHYVNDKDDRKPEILAEDQDTLPLNNDYRRENPLPFNLWNPYNNQESIPYMPSSQFNRYPPLFSMLGIPTTLFIPFPLVLSPDYLYPSYSGNEDMVEEQMMSRANSRRPSSYRNSPIYYVRMPPTPYMFVPGLGYTSQPPIFSPMLSYNHLSSIPIQPPMAPIQPPISPMINLPLNFLANGKPSSIYQLDGNGLQSPYQSYPGPILPPPPPQLLSQGVIRPLQRPSSYMQPSSSPSLYPDSKITHLKRPFLFNGRPEDIYLLPNNFNSMQSIYQSPQQGYY